MVKVKELLHNYRQHINPPYSRKDIPSILTTLFLLVLIPITTVLASERIKLFSRASSESLITFMDLNTLQVIESTTSAQVGVLLTSPWPIAAVHDSEVAGLVAQKNPTGTTQDTSKDKTGTPTTIQKGPTVSPPSVTGAPTERTVSILLAQDSNFSRNLLTIMPVTSNPFLARYTFSDSSPGTKTIYAKFISSSGSNQVFSRSIQLISPSATSTPPASVGRPYPGAPLCPDSAGAHNNSVFHTLWDSTRGCHYDHEHGQSPLVPQVATIFPGFDLLGLTGGVSIGHTNPSSAMENTHKHGGFKWQFMPAHPQGCAGFESSTNGVNGSVIQIHGFGDYSVELQGRIHSSLALLRMCNAANPTDYGYLYTVQFQDYGQIVSPYQGDIIPFPFTPSPSYDPARGPYLTIDCVGQKAAGERGVCRQSLQQILSGRLNTNSNWSAKPSGSTNISNPFGSTLFNVFFRLRDNYQVIDWSDKTYPFTFLWLCSSDGGLTFDPRGCKYNNSTIQVHEIAGKIPASWDNLSGFDTDSRVGRITATGFTDRFGTLNRTCTSPEVSTTPADRSTDCFPIKMVNAFVGSYGSVLVFTEGKGTNIVPLVPEKDIYFCNGVECREGDANAVPSGWIGPKN